MRYSLVLLFFLTFFHIQCTSDRSETTEDTASSLAIKEYQFERFSPSCAEDSSSCANFTAQFPMILSEGQAELSPVLQRINQAVRNEVKEALWVGEPGEDLSGQSLDALCAQFFADYDRVLAEADYEPMPWAVEAIGELVHQSEECITVAINSYQFTGGAHPNSYTSFLNFDRTDGSLLEWADVLVDSTAFLNLAENQFRRARQIGTNVALDQAGFFWGGSFHPPANFSLEAEGMRLFYNNYEIAPYALGPTDFMITYDQLSDVVKPRFLAQEME